MKYKNCNSFIQYFNIFHEKKKKKVRITLLWFQYIPTTHSPNYQSYALLYL